MWTKSSILALRLKMKMSYWQFAEKLGVSVPTVEMWENGSPVTTFDQAKLDSLERQSDSYLRDKLRAQEVMNQHEAAKQKSEYSTEILPDQKGSITIRRK